ncbi:hypothetical protein [Pseudomonas fluorescens]|uniref:hypothetical protein n=1 Tax=Pseudomonas fluorescens TaxID=294 RepID=UPI00123F6FEA|nr:hypothetical protein [Pseudomonas fluorescens]
MSFEIEGVFLLLGGHRASSTVYCGLFFEGLMMSFCLAITDADWALTKDVFSIIGTIASVLGVGLAFYVGLEGLSTWKKQLKGTADHKLARDAAIVLRKYKNELATLWNYAESAAVQIDGESWIGSNGEDAFTISIYQPQVDRVRQVRAELEPIALECAAIFEGVFVSGFDRLYLFEEACCNCVDSYLQLVKRGGFDARVEFISLGALKSWQMFEAAGVVDDKTSRQFIEGILSPILLEINKRLMKDVK